MTCSGRHVHAQVTTAPNDRYASPLPWDIVEPATIDVTTDAQGTRVWHAALTRSKR